MSINYIYNITDKGLKAISKKDFGSFERDSLKAIVAIGGDASRWEIYEYLLDNGYIDSSINNDWAWEAIGWLESEDYIKGKPIVGEYTNIDIVDLKRIIDYGKGLS